jgi:hypothetical protein
MEKFIYTYLSENYYIQTSEVGNYGIYQKYDDRRIPVPFNGDRLIKDVVTVFGVTKAEAKSYIHLWAKSIDLNVDLEFYWKIAEEFGNLMFPVIQQVAARTISLDLISVQPMSAPTGDLLYLDYVYSKESTFEKVIKFFQNIYKRIFGLFKN